MFKNVTFSTPWVASRVVFVNPFLMSASSRVLNIASTPVTSSTVHATFLLAAAQQKATTVDEQVGETIATAIARALGLNVGNISDVHTSPATSEYVYATVDIVIATSSSLTSSAKPPYRSRLLVSSDESSDKRLVLRSGKSFRVTLRRVDGFGHNLSLPLLHFQVPNDTYTASKWCHK